MWWLTSVAYCFFNPETLTRVLTFQREVLLDTRVSTNLFYSPAGPQGPPLLLGEHDKCSVTEVGGGGTGSRWVGGGFGCSGWLVRQCIGGGCCVLTAV